MMLRVVLVDDDLGRIHDLGSLPTDDPSPVSMPNRGRITNLARRHPGIAQQRQRLVVNIDGQPRTSIPVTSLLGARKQPRAHEKTRSEPEAQR
jgi:hypothetical protein